MPRVHQGAPAAKVLSFLVLLLGAAALFYGFDNATEVMENRVAVDFASPSARPGVAGPLPRGKADSNGFYERLPVSRAVPESIAAMHRIAQESGLAVEGAEFVQSRPAGSRLIRYDVSLVVNESYPKVKKFSARLLSELPHFGVEQLSFQRQRVGDAKAETQIRLVAYFRE